jgi:hypothetical protein
MTKRHTLVFNFGYSHPLFFYNFNNLPINLTKIKFSIIGLNFLILKKELQLLSAIRPINIFTQKGLRIFLYNYKKKVGKVSAYF